ncbi:hypothetical protein KQX54_012781, partial [Cotesia glomerata]
MPKKRGHRAGRRIQARRSREKVQNSKENEKVVENIPLPQITNIRRVQRRLKIVILNNSEGEIDTGLYLPRVRFPDSDPLGLSVRGEKPKRRKTPHKINKRTYKKGVKIIIPKIQSPKPYHLSLKNIGSCEQMSDDDKRVLRSQGSQNLLPGLPLTKVKPKHNLTFIDSGLGTSGFPGISSDEDSEEETNPADKTLVVPPANSQIQPRIVNPVLNNINPVPPVQDNMA